MNSIGAGIISSLSGTSNLPIELQYGLFTTMPNRLIPVRNCGINSSSSSYDRDNIDAARLAMCMLDDGDESMCNFMLLLHVDLQSNVVSVSSSTGTYYNAL